MINHTIKILLFILILSVNISAQDITTEANKTSQDTIFVMQKSPWTAVLLSAAVPGLGQVYNESYWKVPVIYGIGAWLVYNWIDNNDQYKFYKDLYQQNPVENVRTLRTFYRDQRDLFAIYIGLTYLLTLVDAYVDAHLFDFTVEEDFYTGQKQFGIRINF